MKYLLILTLLTSNLLYAQYNEGAVQLNGSAYSTLDGEVKNGTYTGIRVLPVTIDISHRISADEYNSLTVNELRATLIGGKALFAFDEDLNTYFGIGGEVLGLDQRRLFLKDGPQSIYTLEYFRLNALGAFSIGGNVYLQLEVHFASGTPLSAQGANQGVFDMTQDQIDSLLEKANCMNCDTDFNSNAGTDITNSGGGSITINYKRFDLTLSYNTLYANAQWGWSEAGLLEEGESGIGATWDVLTSIVEQESFGIQLQYEITSPESLYKVAVFAGLNFYEAIRANRGSHERSRRNTFVDANNNYLYRWNHKRLGSAAPNEITRSTLFNVGLRVNLPAINKKKKKTKPLRRPYERVSETQDGNF